MQTIPLGQSGLRVPEFCLGTMTYSTQTPEDDAHRQIDMTVEAGMNFVDTAEMYPVNPVRAETCGDSERVIGNWVARHGQGKLIIATKVTGEGSAAIPGGAPIIDGPRLRAACEASLTRLQSDTIDIYQLHWPNRGSYQFRRNWRYVPKGDRAQIIDNLREVLAEAAKLIAEGKIRSIALSNESAWGLSQWTRLADEAGLPRVVTVQNEYSLLCRLFDTDMAEASVFEDVPLLAFSPLATGLLTGKYAGNVIPEGTRRALNPDLGGRVTARVFEAVAAYQALALDWGVDLMQMALAWHRTRPFTSIPIVGASTAGQLAAQIPAFSMTLEPELIAAIDEVHKAHPMPY